MASISGNKFLRQQAFVNGEWVGAADGRVMDVLNPATGEKIAQVPVMQRSDVARACEVANAAWDDWKRTTAKVNTAL
jgi:succinate-semialdehyde dehydrogenase/glutarate-semialdehyde dehydrogenase